MTKKYETYTGSSFEQVKLITANLDIAKIVPLQLNDNTVIKNIDNFVGIYNVSKGRFCATVVPYYNLIQHKDYFNSVAKTLDKINIKYTMSIQQLNNRAFADIEFNGHNIKLENVGEEFTSGLRLTNSYDKSLGLLLAPEFKRLICSNGMIITDCENSLSIKHHSRMANKIESFIEKKVNEIINMHDDLKGWVNGCMKDSIEWKICCRILEKMFVQPKHRSEILKVLGISMIDVTEKKKTKTVIYDYTWDEPKNKKIKLTRWELYNAITSYLSHSEQITPHIQDLFQRRCQKLLVTPLIELPVLKTSFD